MMARAWRAPAPARTRAHARLDAPGFGLIGGGLLLMRGLTVDSGWTHVLAGMIVAGIGAGFVNVPLAATAIGIVEPARAGMASGINTTFRQVGTATGVAVLGALFAGHLHVASGPQLRAGVIDGLNEILLVGAATAFAGAVATLLLVRERDFVDSAAHEAPAGQPEPVPTPA